MNKSFFVSFGSFNERNQRVDLGKDSFIERVRMGVSRTHITEQSKATI